MSDWPTTPAAPPSITPVTVSEITVDIGVIGEDVSDNQMLR